MSLENLLICRAARQPSHIIEGAWLAARLLKNKPGYAASIIKINFSTLATIDIEPIGQQCCRPSVLIV